MSDTDTTESSSKPSSNPQSSNGIFQKWSRQFALVTGLSGTEEERKAELQAFQHKGCNKWKKELMNYSPAVVFMLKRLELSGCPVTQKHIRCEPCDGTRHGGYRPHIGITVLCHGGFLNKKHMEQTMVHELVHMYDECYFKVNWNDLRHHACSEIRANSLSGDCKLSSELNRGVFGFTKHHQACVRRRSVASVAGNPACPDMAAAEQAVNEVWDSCFNDTRPFDEIY